MRDGRIGYLMCRELRSRRIPYGIEVIADPYDMFAPGAVRHPLRPLFRWYFTPQLRKHCHQACAALYVTENALQCRYPCPGWSGGASTICLRPEAFHPVPRVFGPSGEGCEFRLVTVGSLAQMYKATDVLIEAMAACVKEGLNLKLDVVGDGRHRAELETRALKLGLADRVSFLGRLPAGGPVRARLDEADLFVLPSRQEGLPRAIIEAMARALPCIGSTVGGIPELLPREDLVPPGDVAALARQIAAVLTNPARMGRMSARNLQKAKEYQHEILRVRWTAFHRAVKESTAAWMRSNGSAQIQMEPGT